MSIFRGDEDRFELRALQLEVEQRQRFEAGGSHREFWNSRYEQMQLFLIERYRMMSKTWGAHIVEHRTQESPQRFALNSECHDPSGNSRSSQDGHRTTRVA